MNRKEYNKRIKAALDRFDVIKSEAYLTNDLLKLICDLLLELKEKLGDKDEPGN